METRYCIEYINPKYPLLDNGSINVRYDRVLTLKQAEHDLTLILSFGAKILNLYMGNVVDGKTGEWNLIPIIINDDDWFTMDWLKLLKPQKPAEWNEEDEKMIGRIRSIVEKYAFSQSAVDVNGDLCEKEYIDADNWLKSLKEKIR